MQGNWNNGRSHYRCRFPREYAIANKVQHPLAVYVREDALLPPLDHWLSEVFAPHRIEGALTAMADSQPSATTSPFEAARSEIADCDRKLARHRAALESGADPALIAAWSADVQRQRAAAEARLASEAAASAARRPLSKAEIRATVESFGGLLKVLHGARPEDKTEVYRQLGLGITYRHNDKTALAEVQPEPSMCVVVVSGGGADP